VDAVVLVRERLEPESKKLIRLVQESNSRKENFTVQQYLYTTVYYRMSRGEPITIQGWQTFQEEANGTMVEFAYVDSEGIHVAKWAADPAKGTVTPRNELAVELSWH
jgi:hypothetical protein